MSEVGDFESFDAPQGSEQAEQNDEKFREQIRKSQQAQQQLQKEESKARKNDDKLAQIIVHFLAQDGNTDLFILISRCVAQNIPSEIIIAVLSLIDQTASEEIAEIIATIQKKGALTMPEYGSMHSLSGEQKEAVDAWIKNIMMAATHKPHRTLETVLVKKTAKNNEIVKEVFAPFIQLSAFIMRNFLAMQDTQIEHEKLRDFMQSVYLKMIQELESMMQGQKQIESSEA